MGGKGEKKVLEEGDSYFLPKKKESRFLKKENAFWGKSLAFLSTKERGSAQLKKKGKRRYQSPH